MKKIRHQKTRAWAWSAQAASAAAFLAATGACGGDDTGSIAPTSLSDAGDATTHAPDASESAEASTDASTGASTDASLDGPSEAADADSAAPPPPCSGLPGTIVYIESGDTQEALLKKLGRQLRDTADITIVYWLTGSCSLTPNLYNGTAIAPGQVMDYIPSTLENPTWTTADAESTCSITTATPPQLGISALYPESCGLGLPEAGAAVGLIDGPIQAYTFIVPPSVFTSDGMAIYAEEAHTAFGANKGTGLVTLNGSAEWNDPTQMFFRPTTKSTLVSTAFNIELTAAVMAQGAVQESASSGVLTAVAAATSANAIGILGDEVYDTQGRGKVNVLAFKAFGQDAAYFPDSTPTAFDKQNIRDGHYAMWSPTVYLTDVDSTGEPTNPAIKYITDTIMGSSTAVPPDGGAPIDGLADITGVGLTPGCAMQVTRATPLDGTPISPAATPPTCTCYFLSIIPGATGTPANCTTCTTDSSACPSGQTCLRGFCEGTGAGVPAYAGDGGGCDSTTTVGLNACTNAESVVKTGIVVGDAGL
jgi:hypothetical protein